MKGANKKDAATGAIRMVQVSAPGATSRARCTRRSPLLRDALFATSSNPSAPEPEVLIVRGPPLRREQAGSKIRGPFRRQAGIRICLGWRMAGFGVILVAGLDRLTLTPVRRSAAGVASRRATRSSQAPTQ